ncbi:MAG: D-serine ammonia-lyase [Filifactoraceae bacterium]
MNSNNLLDNFKNNITISSSIKGEETFWLNPNLKPFKDIKDKLTLSEADILDAEARMLRFAPYIERVFPETKDNKGIIESELKEIENMRSSLWSEYKFDLGKRLFLKMDSELPIAGSVKARGGIYEILKYAEELALSNGLLNPSDDYSVFAEQRFVDFFSKYKIQVGSTGNLGMSIGIISAKLGFEVIVHMSSDAKDWKKELLRSKGVTVIEYKTDYSQAVEEGRNNSDKDPLSYFVDDENSVSLFLGYSVAALRLKKQFSSLNIEINKDNPLFVYLPCGIGGAPGGIAFGLKTVFGDNVHCFFVEPVNACCMLLGMATQLHDKVSVQDFGISGITHADGLAVGRPSAFVGKFMEPMLSGIFTINDFRLYDYMRNLMDKENIFIEPSGCSAFSFLQNLSPLKTYISQHNMDYNSDKIIHVAWATGGSMVPKNVIEIYTNTFL